LAKHAMPFTYFAHQLFVLPLKQSKPRWFDGTALCIGSMAPDFAYALERSPFAVSTHNLPAQLFWTLPVACALTWLIRNRLAVPLGAQLPAPLGGEVQALANSRHPFGVTASSAVLGGLTHIFVDAFTHPHGWAFERLSVLRVMLFDLVTVSTALQYLGHSVGTALGFMWFARLVAARRISGWNGSAAIVLEAEVPRVRWFWPTLAQGSALCALVAALLMLRGYVVSIAVMRASALELLLVTGLALSLRRLSIPDPRRRLSA
jgi:hypothetical protein